MKRLLLIAWMAVPMAACAQTSVELQEVTVRGARVQQRTDGQWIYPSEQQLENATDGYSLLAKLALPNVRVDQAMHTVASAMNLGEVQVRINDIPATQEELLALELKGVERVEFVDRPGLRYGEDVACVINFVVRKPVSGYTVGTSLTNTLTTVNGRESVYGKMNVGKSEWGVHASVRYQHFDGMAYDERAAYQLESGEVQTAFRRLRQGVDESVNHFTQLTYSLSDTSYVFQTRLSLDGSLRPRSVCSQMVVDGVAFTDRSSYRNASPILDVYVHRNFRKHQSLTANVVGTTIGSHNQTESNEGGAYRYAVDGRTWSLWGEAFYENRLKPFTVGAGVQHAQRYLHNVYAGDAEADNGIRSASTYVFGQLRGRLGAVGYLGGIGGSRVYYRQAATHYECWMFRPRLTLTYPVVRNLTVKYDFGISQHTSQIALVSDVCIKQNGLETLVGNPAIRPNCVTEHDFRLTYTLPRLTAELEGFYRLNAHCNMEKYVRRDGRFYQTQTNADNACNFFYVQGYGRWEIVSERLTATVYGGIFRFFNNGEDYRHTYTSFNGGADLELNWGRWALTAHADNGWNFMEGEHRGHQAPAWYLTASCRLKRLTVSLYAQHIFSQHPVVSRSEVVSRFVSKEMRRRSGDLGNMLTLNFTWELSSGRKYRDVKRTMNHQDGETGILQK